MVRATRSRVYVDPPSDDDPPDDDNDNDDPHPPDYRDVAPRRRRGYQQCRVCRRFAPPRRLILDACHCPGAVHLRCLRRNDSWNSVWYCSQCGCTYRTRTTCPWHPLYAFARYNGPVRRILLGIVWMFLLAGIAHVIHWDTNSNQLLSVCTELIRGRADGSRIPRWEQLCNVHMVLGLPTTAFIMVLFWSGSSLFLPKDLVDQTPIADPRALTWTILLGGVVVGCVGLELLARWMQRYLSRRRRQRSFRHEFMDRYPVISFFD